MKLRPAAQPPARGRRAGTAVHDLPEEPGHAVVLRVG